MKKRVTKNFPEWVRKPIPDSIQHLEEDQLQSVLSRFEELAEFRNAPSNANERDKLRAIDWPKPPLIARVLPGGILLMEDEGYYDSSQQVEELFTKFSSQGVVFWGIGAEKYGVFQAPFDAVTRRWIKAELIFSPTCILSLESDLIMISDEQLDFSVIGGSPLIINEMEKLFGGAKELKKRLLKAIDDRMIGFGKDDQIWAKEYLLPWSE
ncbi:MAG: hypothetical protein COA60_004590 [Robiginitomaculum sp.]|nr:hypothetical protein [Robiginitomaculum sp.]MBL4853391.1 hypothetical protein [Robiginitomaculum sp.]